MLKFGDGVLKSRRALGYEVFELHGTVSELRLCGAQRFLSLALMSDICEKNGHPAQLGRFNAKGVDIEPSTQDLGVILEAHGFTGESDAAIGLEPMPFERGDQFQHPPALRSVHPGLFFESGVGLHVYEVDCALLRVKEDLDNAESFVNGFEQRTVAALTFTQSLFGLLAPANIVKT